MDGAIVETGDFVSYMDRHVQVTLFFWWIYVGKVEG